MPRTSVPRSGRVPARRSERDVLGHNLRQLDLQIRWNVPGDGSCWFHSVLDQCDALGLQIPDVEPGNHATVSKQKQQARAMQLRNAVLKFFRTLDPDDPLVESVNTPGCFDADTVKRMAKYGEYVDAWVVRATARMIRRDINITSSSVFENNKTYTVEGHHPGVDEAPLLIGQLIDGCHFISLEKTQPSGAETASSSPDEAVASTTMTVAAPTTTSTTSITGVVTTGGVGMLTTRKRQKPGQQKEAQSTISTPKRKRPTKMTKQITLFNCGLVTSGRARQQERAPRPSITVPSVISTASSLATTSASASSSSTSASAPSPAASSSGTTSDSASHLTSTSASASISGTTSASALSSAPTPASAAISDSGTTSASASSSSTSASAPSPAASSSGTTSDSSSRLTSTSASASISGTTSASALSSAPTPASAAISDSGTTSASASSSASLSASASTSPGTSSPTPVATPPTNLSSASSEPTPPNTATSYEAPPLISSSTPSADPSIPVPNPLASSNLPDIYSYVNDQAIPDDTKHYFLQKTNRMPETGFAFPPKLYKDKRNTNGLMKRYCSRGWIGDSEFLCYSKCTDGLFCVACALFPDTSHRRPKQLISEPYRNWKDAKNDFIKHSTFAYHKNSMAKMNAFKQSYTNTTHRIDVTIEDANVARVKQNRESIKSIIKSLELCGRQGIALRGHRDDDTSSSFNAGNFKALLQFRVEAGDEILSSHLETCAKNAKYTSKTSQNELLLCMKEFIQQEIINEVKSQSFGPYFTYQCDEVTDSSNWEQLGLVLRYTVNNKPVERLLEFVLCECITGEALCQKIINSLSNANLDIKYCRYQTMDGAGNMAGPKSGCAARFQKENPKALYIHCASHQLNLTLCKSCRVNEIKIMLDNLKQLGLFFKYSPKRSRRLEEAVDEANKKRDAFSKINKSKVKPFCETRWVEKQVTLQDFNDLYEPILDCLEAIGVRERSWDGKSMCDANGLLKKITDSTFIATFQITFHTFGYFRGLASKLQGSTLDIIEGYKSVDHVKSLVSNIRRDADDEFTAIYQKMQQMASTAQLDTLQIPRLCSQQTLRNNVPADTVEEYFKLAVFIPFLDALIADMGERFSTVTKQAVQGLKLLPAHLHLLDQAAKDMIFEHYRSDLPSASSFYQELKLWQALWQNEQSKPSNISDTLDDNKTCALMYPNVTTILRLLLLAPLTSCGVERANSALRFIKNPFRSTMGEDRFNALILLYVHKDIELDYERIIDMYAQKHPRKMVLINPLA